MNTTGLDIKDHELYELCYRAHCGTSFSPEKRAESSLAYYDAQVLKLNEKDIPVDKFKSLFISWQHAKSRVMSPMITGPARFPVDRNRKRIETEGKRCSELDAYMAKVFLPPKPEKLTKDEEIEALEKKIQELETKHAGLIAAKEDPFRDCCLANNRARIKRAKKSLEALKTEGTEYMTGSVRVVECPADNRIRLFFDGKPDRETIARLKKCAFRWAPSIGAWQGYMTQKNKVSQILIQEELTA